MRTIRAVAFKEIQIYFSSPVAYIVALIFMALSGFFFVRDLGNPFPEASLSNFFQGATFLLIPLAPALTMRLLAEEQKLGTIELLLTSPVRDWEVILGKYLASLVFLLFLLSLTSYYVILLLVFATPDPGPIYSGYLGLVLYGMAALAVGILTSTLTSNQIIAARGWNRNPGRPVRHIVHRRRSHRRLGHRVQSAGIHQSFQRLRSRDHRFDAHRVFRDRDCPVPVPVDTRAGVAALEVT